MAATEELLAGIEVTVAPNSNAHGQPWFGYPRQVYKFPLLYFQNVTNIFAVEHGRGLNGDTIIASVDVNLPPLLVLDSNEILIEVTDTDSPSVGLQSSATNYVSLEVVDHVHRLEIKLDWIAITGGGCIKLELDEVFPMGVLGQLRPRIDLGNLRTKMKRPKRRKKERRMKQIERVGIG